MFFVALLNLWLGASHAQIITENGRMIGQEPNWSAHATIDSSLPRGRENIYQWIPGVFEEKRAKGIQHVLHYPILPTGLLVPARPVLRLLDAKPGDPLFRFLKVFLSLSPDFKSFEGFWEWLGLTPPAKDSGEEYPLGVSIIRRGGADGFTLSCAGCHSSSLFGKTIIGMNTRFPRANSFFHHGQSLFAKAPVPLLATLTGATREERKMFQEAADHVKSIGLKEPVALGLDTSLSQVALSLSKRAPTENAERTRYDAEHPRPSLLDTLVADSKPSVWWNAKYKKQWLADGSVISGNPVFTNFLWNEIGRGVDLPALLDWLKQNPDTIRELTTAVFATEAPQWRDFFGEYSIDVKRAKRGEALYTKNCTQCHGIYEKAWSLSTTEWEELHRKAVRENTEMPAIIDTIRLSYEEKIKDVGTHEGRRLGMQALEEGLNPLSFSKNFGIVIERQDGYLAPPLDGIWARYPYLHNNSVPNLCALMTKPSQRPAVYYSGKAIDPEKDYDQECLGYPLDEKTPPEWKKDPVYRYDTRITGLSNAGHYEGIFTKNGIEKFSAEDKRDLLEYLKTL